MRLDSLRRISRNIARGPLNFHRIVRFLFAVEKLEKLQREAVPSIVFTNFETRVLNLS